QLRYYGKKTITPDIVKLVKDKRVADKKKVVRKHKIEEVEKMFDNVKDKSKLELPKKKVTQIGNKKKNVETMFADIQHKSSLELPPLKLPKYTRGLKKLEEKEDKVDSMRLALGLKNDAEKEVDR